MKISDFFGSLMIAAVIVIGFILLFYPPVVWQMWFNYIMITPVWTSIGQMGFLFLAIIVVAVGVYFAKDLVFG